MEPNLLTVVRWYNKKALYLGEELIYYGEVNIDVRLLNVLDYEYIEYGEVPTHSIPPEFDKGEYDHWKPPEDLGMLVVQFNKYKLRLKQEELCRVVHDKQRVEEEIKMLRQHSVS